MEHIKIFYRKDDERYISIDQDGDIIRVRTQQDVIELLEDIDNDIGDI
jgi:hypothetical protein